MGNPIALIDPTGKSPDNPGEFALLMGERFKKDFEANNKKTNWTKAHEYLNNVFGDANGFNEKISSTRAKYSTKNVWHDEFFSDLSLQGKYTPFRAKFSYTAINKTADKPSTLLVSSYGLTGLTTDGVSWDSKVSVYYGGKLFSSAHIVIPNGDCMHDNLTPYVFIGSADLKLPENPTQKVEVKFGITLGSADENNRVVNTGGFIINRSVSYTIFNPKPEQ